jgi:hypothetical protein
VVQNDPRVIEAYIGSPAEELPAADPDGEQPGANAGEGTADA